MVQKNRFGISRDIPSDVKREVRQRSKFGCVNCRAGLYQYEHIDPVFTDAQKHEANNICCLCGSCHDAVTRRLVSKEAVKAMYEKIQNEGEADFPRGPLDFHNGRSEILIGGRYYGSDARTIIRYHGKDIIKVHPGQDGQPGAISAIFTDDEGRETLRLDRNEWVGSLSPWDIEVEGARITVRKKAGMIALRLRLDPPGRIVIERLDMRFEGAHFLITEQTYAVGRINPDNYDQVFWVQASVSTTERINSAEPVIDFISVIDAQQRIEMALNGPVLGPCYTTANGKCLFGAFHGVVLKNLGINIGRGTSFFMWGMASGIRSLNRMRQMILTNPGALAEFIGTGAIKG